MIMTSQLLYYVVSALSGVPVPNAWLGGMKNIDLVKEFSTSEGFPKAFADGIQNIHVEDGRLIIKIKKE